MGCGWSFDCWNNCHGVFMSRLKNLIRHREHLREKKQHVKDQMNAEMWPLDKAIEQTESEIRKRKRKIKK